MDLTGFEQSIERIYSTGDNEIDCEALQTLLPVYVDAEIAGVDPVARFPAAHAHLVQCPDCAEEYKGLRQVARLEAKGNLPQAEETLAQFDAEPVSGSSETATALSHRQGQ